MHRTLLAALASALMAACATGPTPPLPAPLPIVFVHGNGDSAALWTTTQWRFESNGWPRERLHAVHLPDPLARDDDTIAQPGRSSTLQSAQALAAEVDAVLQRSGAAKVVLVGNSRGGYAIRNYVQNFGGAARVERVVLGGTPNHGVRADASSGTGNEFNGAGPFLTALNAPKGPNGDEVTPGPAWLTLRSDNNDKYAQPDGLWIGAPGKPTNVTFDGPALKGATNLVLPGRDHREVSFHAEAFTRTWEFITGRPPASTEVQPEAAPLLDGQISGLGPAGPDNRPLAGALLQIYAVDAATGARQGEALHSKTVGADGRWGPFAARPGTPYEFVVSAAGYAVTHVYRSPFPRGSAIVHLRADKLQDADRAAQSVLVFTRPRGYFGIPRDRVVFDGISPPPGVPAGGVAGIASSRLRLAAGAGRPVVGEFDSGPLHERIVARAWPAAENHLVVLELHQ